ncbi:MAG TPA: NUDIX-like domain-containing protein, partial [Xanthobacteraceae bacterium]|nr:NUDIX-like domain-containing protein [Xanthobacteraceae bacterium]
MTIRSELGPWPYLGYTASRIDRAAACRTDDGALAKFAGDPAAGFYLIGGELVVLRKDGELLLPLFAADEARAFGGARETLFLGLMDSAPRFGIGLDAKAVEPLKTRDDLKLTDLRSIAVHGLV